ncbi:hypothetical protein [Deinococcus arenicola]|uniref:Uncharacterized protein n=1 Tax=Deinococcus arenicola TaxID=2994950 RepID=A0ABU4DX32_9DEIO|nr:hypothetical protein [Deinococcus sp. ZS9-10]MDV6376445.1 hypothetical protein [Deinococcus sp. ZS9-10]
MKTLKNLDSARTQLRLHVMLAIHVAIETDSLVPLKEITVPTIVPAGLGSSTPLKSSGDTQGSELVHCLGAAMINHTATPRPHLEAQLARGVAALKDLPPPPPRRRGWGYWDLYAVRVPALRLQTSTQTLSVPGQALTLDCRTGELEQALRTVWLAERPAKQDRGALGRQHASTPAHLWAAWELLAAAALLKLQTEVLEREAALAHEQLSAAD